ncbi:UL49A [Papiine alphaherpesvirus 2]|uniref:Envelope glycoprotein N n=1 Tax=Cercopithecine herpesvirus 16 TaxID=340907 RepID=Q2QBC6_CHV16|nr:envelope glycoprotein N [Papiine alphaherpesvirus 2]UYB79386.1 envelope glycoprotein N [synthetic construct]ABA29304.1 UL49A [Papiine alphaherpesvirus 2]AHM96026.1 envelope glycoprotein N [Papiine alphaherpesvirus 2]UYB79459.1 envelope glycoprotein N [synthetic construct]UYB79533.1 envelope glycoprotein N [Papiine alphaherpesvirus 2]
MGARVLLLSSLLSLCAVGALAGRAPDRSPGDFCGGRGAEYVSAPGVLVPFYLGMASLGVSLGAHVYWVVRRLFVARDP